MKIKYIAAIILIWVILLYAGIDKKGSTSERPASPRVGYMYYNTSDSVLQLWDGNNWRNIENIDSLNTVIGDSIANLGAVNGLMEIGRNFGQKIIKDTVVLKAYKPDSAGTIVNLKQLASGNTNGGGLMIYKSSGSALNGVRWAAAGGGIWERYEVSQKQPITPRMFGAKADGSTDDTTPLQLAFTTARSLGYGLDLTNGTYKITSPISIPSDNDIGYIVFGRGISRTKILASGCTAFRWTSGQHDNIVFRDFEIERSAVGADTGLVILTTTGGLFQNLKIDNFRVGIHVTTSEDNLFDNIGGAADTFGIVLTSNSNGNTISRGGFTADSAAYVSNASHGNIFKGLDLGNHPISFQAQNISDFIVIGGQFESHSNTVFWIENNCKVTVSGGRTQGSTSSVLAYMGGVSRLSLYDHDITGFTGDSTFWFSNTSPRVQWFGRGNVAPVSAYISSSGAKLPVYPNVDVRRTLDFGSTVPQRGQIVALEPYLNADTSSTQAHLLYGQQIGGVVRRNFLTDGSDWRYDSNGLDSTHATRFDRMRYYIGVASGTTSAGDSTEVSVWTDTSGVTSFVGFYATVDRTSPDATPMAAWVSQLSSTAASGLVKFLVWHKYDTGGGISFRINYLIIAQAKTTGLW